MWYKIVKNNVVIDILKKLIYIKSQSNGVNILCSQENAEMILSSDAKTIYPLNEINIYQITQEDYQALTAKIIPIETSNKEEIIKTKTKIQKYDKNHKDVVYRYNTQAAEEIRALKNHIFELEQFNQTIIEQNDLLKQKLEKLILENNKIIQGLFEISQVVYA